MSFTSYDLNIFVVPAYTHSQLGKCSAIVESRPLYCSTLQALRVTARTIPLPPPSPPSRPSSCGLACYEALPAEENSEQANAPGRSATGSGPVWSRPNRAIQPAAGVRTRTNSDIRTRHKTEATDRHTDRRVESDRGYNFSKLNERRAQRVKSAQGTIKILINSDFSSDLTPFSNHYWAITQRRLHSHKIYSYTCDSD